MLLRPAASKDAQPSAAIVGKRGFVLLPRRRTVERSFAWRAGCEDLPRIMSAAPQHWQTCISSPSHASCSNRSLNSPTVPDSLQGLSGNWSDHVAKLDMIGGPFLA